MIHFYDNLIYNKRMIEKHRQTIGILGGTFNPPHNGHLFLAESIYCEFCLDQVVFLPVGNPPHKRNQQIADAAHRLAMLRILVEGKPHIAVSSLEVDRQGYTYTVDSLHALHVLYPDTKFYYIIGADTLFELTTWRNHAEVFSLTEFLCVMRPGINKDALRREMARLEGAFGAAIHLSSYRGPQISSTDIRDRIRQRKGTEGMIPADMRAYIEDHGIFR